MNKIYFDYASTTPVDPEVLQVMAPFFYERFGNPSSPHSFGRDANKALEDARAVTASLIGARPEEIVFTSGATEANNHAVIGAARANRDKGRHIITTRMEHHSVIEPMEFLEREGFQVTFLAPDADGRVDPRQVAETVTEETILISVMHASNEIGTVQPVAEIGRLAKERKILFHVDAVQTAGHVPVSVDDLNADLLSVSAHKFYGPKGCGTLYIRRGTPLRPYLLGGDQERGRRASTVNVAGAVGAARAAELCRERMDEEASAQAALRDRLIDEVLKRIDGTRLNGPRKGRLPNNAHFSFEGVSGEALLMSLDMQGICASMGSACTSGALKPSRVLKAIGLSDEAALGALRISMGRWTTAEDTEKLIEDLPRVVKKIRMI